jgi:hypothetical protein
MAGFLGNARQWRKFEKRSAKLFDRYKVDEARAEASGLDITELCREKGWSRHASMSQALAAHSRANFGI